MKFRKIIYFILIISLGLFLTGCFKFEERIILKKDGSGMMEVEYWTLKDVNINDDNFNFPKEDKEIRKEIEKKYTSEKVKLTEFHVKEKSKSHYVRFKVTFNNIIDLNEVPQFQENHIQFKKSGKKYQFKRTIYLQDNKCDKSDEAENIFESLIIHLVEEGLSKIKFRFELEMPFKIDETNATWTPDDKRAIWKYDLSEAMYKNEIEMTVSTK